MTNGGSNGRGVCAWGAIVALLVMPLFAGTGCDEEAALQAFRDASSDSLETGVKSLMDGIIEGFFAIVDLTDDSSSSSSTTATSS